VRGVGGGTARLVASLAHVLGQCGAVAMALSIRVLAVSEGALKCIVNHMLLQELLNGDGPPHYCGPTRVEYCHYRCCDNGSASEWSCKGGEEVEEMR